MKIIFPFSGTSIGGSNISSLILINELIINKYDVKLILHKKGIFSNYLDKKSIPYHVLNKDCFLQENSKIKNLLNIIKFFFFGIYYLFQNNKSIFHFNEYRVSFTWIIPFIFSKNYFILHARSRYFKSLFLNLICKRANKIITISKYIKKSFPSHFNYKILNINNPIKLPFQKIDKAKFYNLFHLDKNKITITFISNFKMTKRPLMFVDIAGILAENKENLQFVMYGNYTKKFESILIKKIYKTKLQNKLFYFGFQEDIDLILSNSDIVVLPGINEGLGRVALESFINKALVVASNSGGYKEIIKNNKTGLLAKVDDSEDFVKKIINILNNDNKKKDIVINAYNYVKNNYSTKIHLKKIINIYKSFVKYEK